MSESLNETMNTENNVSSGSDLGDMKVKKERCKAKGEEVGEGMGGRGGFEEAEQVGPGRVVVRVRNLPAAATRGNLTTLCREMGEVVGVQVGGRTRHD